MVQTAQPALAANVRPISTARVPFEELKKRAQAMVPTLRERAEQTERNRRVSAETTEMIRAADIFRMMQPARFGGFEYGFSEMIDISFEIARGCGSTAWCAGLGIVHQWLLALFPIEAQEEVWQNPGAILAGSYAPAGTLKVESGGYRITGKWSYMSNGDNADWYLVGVMLPPAADGGRPMPGFLLVPREQCTIEDDWFTVGLAGTGSKSVVIGGDGVFVPAHRRLSFAEAASNAAPGTRVHTNSIYRVPFLAGIPASLATPSLGIVQGAIEEFVDWIGARTTRGAVVAGGNRMAEFAAVQSRVAEASAAIDAGKLLLQRDTLEVQASAAAGEVVTVDKRIRNRRDQAYAVRLAVQGANALFEAVGGAGLNLSSGTQRAWRDVNSIARHISLNWDAVSTMYGQHQFGLEPKGQY